MFRGFRELAGSGDERGGGEKEDSGKGRAEEDILAAEFQSEDRLEGGEERSEEDEKRWVERDLGGEILLLSTS